MLAGQGSAAAPAALHDHVRGDLAQPVLLPDVSGCVGCVSRLF